MKRLRMQIRRVMILLALGLLLVAMIVLFNTLRLQSKQVQVSPIAPVVLDQTGCVERLRRALQPETIADENPQQIDPQPFLALHEYLEKAFPRTHETLKRETAGEGGLSLLYTWEGTDPAAPPFLLMSHVDVVPVERDSEASWTHPPFAGHVADGYVWGRGALDVKCGAVAILEAVEFLLAEGFPPACTIYIALGHDEEVGGRNGNAKIAARLELKLKQRDQRLRYVLDEGGAILNGVIEGPTSPVAFIGVAEKGPVGLRLTATGPTGHPSMPPRQTAVGILAKAIDKLESDPMPTRIDGATELMLDYLGPEMPFHQKAILANRWLFGALVRHQFAKKPSTNATIQTTLAATMLEGSVARNVLPEKASAYLNVRLLPGDTAESVLARVKRVVNDDRVTCCLEPNAKEASPVSDTNSRAFATLVQSIREVFPGVIVAPGLTTVSTDSPHYAAIADNTFRFIPMRLTQADLKRIHGPNERISVANYLEVIRFFIRQIRNSAS